MDPSVASLPRDDTAAQASKAGLAGKTWAPALVSAYLAASAAVLLVHGDYRTAVVNAALLAAVVAISAVGSASALVVFAPLVIAVALYGEIPRLIAAAGTSYHDAIIQHLELAVFGTEPSRTFAGAVPVPALSELLHAGYMCFYPMIFLPPLVLYWRREQTGLEETIFALTLTWIVCWVLFVSFPVEGPRYLWGAPAGVPNGPVRRLATAILAAGSSRGAAFPSSHMAVSVTQTIFAWKYQRRGMAVAVTIVTVLVGVGAVYGGFHYGIDMIAGAGLGVVLAFAAVLLAHAEESIKVPRSRRLRVF